MTAHSILNTLAPNLFNSTTEAFFQGNRIIRDNLYSVERNGTIFVPRFAFPDPLSPVQLVQRAVSLLGFVGNLIAMAVVLRGRSIRKNASYVLLFNQSLTDFLSCFYVLVWPLAQHLSGAGKSGKNGPVDYAVCVMINSQALLKINAVVSTFNLTMLAVERMLCILFPIFHRVHATDFKQRLAALLVWPAVFCAVIPFVIADNGIDASGRCRFNDRISGKLWFDISYEILVLYFPLLVIVVCYSMIVYSLQMSQSAVKKRLLNVLKTLVTVVVVYVLCSSLRSILAMMSALGVDLGLRRMSLFTIAYSMKIVSFVINPFIYTLQYADYRTELRKLFGFKNNKINNSGTHGTSSTA